MSGDLTPAQHAAHVLAGQERFRLTPERFQRVVELVGIGNYASVAAAAASLSERSFYRYLSVGREVEAKVAERFGDDHGLDEALAHAPDDIDVSANEWTCWRLFHAISKASAEAEAYAVAIVRQAMPETVESAQWFLERGRSRRWKRRDAHELDVVDARGAEGEDQDLLRPRGQRADARGTGRGGERAGARFRRHRSRRMSKARRATSRRSGWRTTMAPEAVLGDVLASGRTSLPPRWSCTRCGARVRSDVRGSWSRPPSPWRMVPGGALCPACLPPPRRAPEPGAEPEPRPPPPARAPMQRRPAVDVVRGLLAARPGLTTAELIAATGVSEATVFRVLRALGAVGTWRGKSGGPGKAWRLPG